MDTNIAAQFLEIAPGSGITAEKIAESTGLPVADVLDALDRLTKNGFADSYEASGMTFWRMRL